MKQTYKLSTHFVGFKGGILLMALSLVMAFMPRTANAQTVGNLWFGNSTNKGSLSGNLSAANIAGDAGWSWDAATATLTLDNTFDIGGENIRFTGRGGATDAINIVYTGNVTITTTQSNAIENSGGTLVIDGSGGTLTLAPTSGGIIGGGSSVTINSGTVVVNNVADTGISGNNVTISSGASVTINNAGYEGISAGNGVNISGNVTITGTVSGGNSIWSSVVGTTISGGTVSVDGSINGDLSVTSGTATIGGTVSGTITLTGGATLGFSTDNINLPNNIILNGANTLNTGAFGNINISGVISGTGGLTKQGSGALILLNSGVHNYSGETTISDGRFVLYGSLEQSSDVTVTGNGIFDLSGATSPTTTINGLNGNGTVMLGGNNNLTINNTSSSSFTGIISQLQSAGVNCSLTKTGTGTLTLTGANIFYTGGTTVSSGTLVINGNLNSDLIVNGTGSVIITGTHTGTQNFSGSGEVWINGVRVYPDPPVFTVTYSVVNGNGTLSAHVGTAGVVSGAPIASGTSVDLHTPVEFIATPARGYQVKEWKYNGAVAPGNTTNTYYLTLVTMTVDLTVEFEPVPAPPSSVDDVQSPSLSAYAQDGALYISGLMAGQPFRVYNVLGALIYQGVANDADTTIALPERSVYIVTDGKTTVKTVY